MRVLHILLEADDGEAFKSFRLVHHRIKAVRVIQGARNGRVSFLPRRTRLLLLLVVVVAAGSLLLEVGRLVDLRLIEDLGFDRVGVQLDVETPLLDLLAAGDHFIQLLNGVDTVVRLLEQTLAHLGHGLFILTHLLGNSDKHGEFRRQIDVLALLFDLEEGLAHLLDLLVVLLLEVDRHGDGLAGLALLEVARLWAHVEPHIAHFVSLVVSVAGHHDGALEFVDHRFLVLLDLGRVVGVAEAFLTEAFHLFINQLEAVVNRKILADVVDNEVEAALEDP